MSLGNSAASRRLYAVKKVDLRRTTRDPDQRFLRWLVDRPAYLLPLLSLYSYIVAATYLDGYLKFFSAQASWFEPGVLRLVSFARAPLILSFFVVTTFCVLAVRKDMSRGKWTALYLVSVVVFVLIAIVKVAADLACDIDISIGAIWDECFVTAVWIFVPPLGRWKYRRAASRIETLNELEEEFCSLKDDPSDKEQKAALSVDIRNISNEIEHRANRWTNKFYWLLLLCAGLNNYLFVCGWIGFDSAFMDSYQLRKAGLTSPDSKRIIFTDGNLSLISKRVGDDIRILLTSNGGADVTELDTTVSKWFRTLGSKEKNAKAKHDGMPATSAPSTEPATPPPSSSR